MKVEIDKNSMVETHTFDVETEEISKVVKIDNKVFPKVKLNFYWDSHGKLIPWENDDNKKSVMFNNAKVLLEEVTTRWFFSKDNYTDWSEWRVTINDERIKAIDCYEYYTTSTGTLVFKMIVGQG